MRRRSVGALRRRHLQPNANCRLDWTVRVSGGQVAIERGRPERPDLRVSADPVTQLLAGHQHMSCWRALRSGRIIGWGRKPWLAARFAKLFVET